MRIKNQFRISIIIFVSILSIIAGAIFVSQQQAVQISNQEIISLDFQTRASNLAYISNDYFLFQQSSMLDQWQTEFAALNSDLSKLSISSPRQQALLNSIKDDAQRLNNRWTDVVSYLQNAPRDVSIRFLPEFQTRSSRMSLQNQALIFDAQQLSQTYRTQIDQINATRVILILTLLGLFGAYFITNYLLTFRKTLKDISELQNGIKIVGSGKLDYSLYENKNDEVGEISRAVNQMTANLKTVTASKADLEREIIERKKAEEKLEEYSKNLEKLVEERTKQLNSAERLAAIGATAGMVGHDIRNPLQAMTSDIYLAKTDLNSMPEGIAKDGVCESLDSLQKNIEYINKIVQDLQDYARPLAPTAKETDVEKILNDVLISKAIPENIIVTRKVETKARKLIADPDLFKRILANLVNNAIQAMPKGGELDVQASRGANDLVITIKDTGVGIPEDIKPKLFTPLFTTKSKGQGFGLAVVKRITEALGGTVSFESEEGKGTTFTIRLPHPQRSTVN